MSILYIIPMFVSGGLIPTYLTVKNVGLIDTFWVMVIPFAVSSYNIIVARTFFNNSIPDGMWEAAQIDGCGTIRYFIKIVVPLSKAIIAVIGLWTAVGIWNSWFNALIYLTNENLQPLQLIFTTFTNLVIKCYNRKQQRSCIRSSYQSRYDEICSNCYFNRSDYVVVSLCSKIF